MSIIAANEVRKGDLIRNSRDGALYYVHDLEKGRERGHEYVESFIAFPILSDKDIPSGSQKISITDEGFKKTDGPVDFPKNAVIAIGERTTKKLIVDGDNFYAANLQGKFSSGIIREADIIFSNLGGQNIRVSDLESDKGKIKSTDYSFITSPVLQSSLRDQDGYKPKEFKKQKAKTIVSVPDIYLEDAHGLGFIDDALYTQLSKGGIATLRDAYTLTKLDDKKGLFGYVAGKSFEKTFPESKKDTLDDVKLGKNETFKSLQHLTLEEALKQNLLQNEFTLQVLQSQGVSDDFDPDEDFDERLIFHVEDALSILAREPEFFKEFDRPDQEDIPLDKRKKLTAKQVQQVSDDLRGAFDKIALGRGAEELSDKIETAFKKFSMQSLDLLRERKAFTIHDSLQEPVTALKPDVEKQRATILAKRPTALKL